MLPPLPVTLLCVLLLISACGQKGPLYLPETAQTETQVETQDP